MSSVPGPYPAPVGKTARRLEWTFLPPNLRAFIERKCGSPVVEAISQTSGFTPGFASVLVCADGSRHFVKAASVKAQRPFADSYREEARKLTALPPGVPSPRLLWHLDDDWVALGIEYVDGRGPATAVATRRAGRRPRRPRGRRRRAHATAGRSDPGPGRGRLPAPPRPCGTTSRRPAPTCRTSTRRPRSRPATPTWSAARHWSTPTSATTTCSWTARRKVWICDWNWPVVGAAWIDTLFTLIGPRGDGVDVESVLASRRLTRDVPPEAIDRVLALLVGYFLKSGDDPVPPTSPFLREHQRWQGEVCWHWLCERRGWL